MFGSRSKSEMVSRERALPGRDTPVAVPATHHVFGTPLTPPFPDGLERAMFGMGCFWGAEKFLWQVDGSYTSFVGYSGGFTPNATYEEVCTGRTGHNEVAVVVFDPATASYEDYLKAFWENHDPTTLNRQGGDAGTQYRSGIYYSSDAQRTAAEESKAHYQAALTAKGFGEITTELLPAGDFYYAEAYHQQYLSKNPHGYCNHGFCQVGYDRQAPSPIADA